MITSQILCITVSFITAFAAVLWLHPTMVDIARKKGITDNPNKRKLQREPIPVLGGVAVFFGIIAGLGCASRFYDCSDIVPIIAVLTLMLYTGTTDDIVGLTPKTRLLIEIIAVAVVIYIGGYSINNFHGLWGIYGLPVWIGIPLTLFAGVGIINSINLIDGVDGLSSGFCITACAIFGVFFWLSGDMTMATIAAACIGALVPFFYHNVFGKRQKMFIGDGGTLVMGMMMFLFVLRVLNIDRFAALPAGAGDNFGLVPFTLAILAIPVFDTIKVMTVRIIHKTSPFSPDKKHLHHAFIERGFSHFATTISILLLNLLIVAGWFAIYKSGYSVNAQLCFTVVAGLLFTTGIYSVAQVKAMSRIKNQKE